MVTTFPTEQAEGDASASEVGVVSVVFFCGKGCFREAYKGCCSIGQAAVFRYTIIHLNVNSLKTDAITIYEQFSIKTEC